MSKGPDGGDTAVKHCDRREFVRALGGGACASGILLPGALFPGASAPGVGTSASAALFPGVLWAKAQEADEITAEMILDAARIAGLEVTADQAESMVREVQDNLETYQEVHARDLGNEVPLPLHFDPRVPGVTVDIPSGPVRTRSVDVRRPAESGEGGILADHPPGPSAGDPPGHGRWSSPRCTSAAFNATARP